MAYKSGFCVLCGRPNVGKSTLMNHFVGQKVAIVSPKAQTTRNCIRGILTGDDYQIVFLDTPGIHKPKCKLNEFMVKEQKEAAIGADFTCVMLDITQPIGSTDEHIIEEYASSDIPCAIVLNKIDLVQKETVISYLTRLAKYDCMIIPVSAQTGEGAEELLSVIKQHLPEGPQYFPEDMVCDFPERFLAAEVIREKALLNLNEEIPHGIGVNINQMQEQANGNIRISADIICERDSHKGIIIGKKGAMIKTIGTLARQELEALLETKVYIELFVKVRDNWRNSNTALKDLGYTE
ncbi:MAG: GTPase Era [Clostridiales bacterium]|nr:GTPase Era [Clostridiales bacterium]